jgi:hypothetical protein
MGKTSVLVNLRAKTGVLLIFFGKFVSISQNPSMRILTGTFTLTLLLNCCIPVRIRVKIDPSYSVVCRKRRLNGIVLRMRSEKPRSRVTAGVAR